MKDQPAQLFNIDADLQARLAALAKQRGEDLPDFAANVLRAHADEAERGLAEQAEDEQRWQRYLETGTSVSFDSVRSKLRGLAAEAAARSEPQ